MIHSIAKYALAAAVLSSGLVAAEARADNACVYRQMTYANGTSGPNTMNDRTVVVTLATMRDDARYVSYATGTLRFNRQTGRLEGDVTALFSDRMSSRPGCSGLSCGTQPFGVQYPDSWHVSFDWLSFLHVTNLTWGGTSDIQNVQCLGNTATYYDSTGTAWMATFKDVTLDTRVPR